MEHNLVADNVETLWKIILRFGGLRFNVEINELSNLQSTYENFTVLLGPQ